MSDNRMNIETDMDYQEDDFPDLSREFDIVDEVTEDGTGNQERDINDDSDFDISDEELDKLLEEDLPEQFRKRKRKRIEEHDDDGEAVWEKYSAEEKCTHHYTALPGGWIFTTHNSGVKVYLHKQSRVCTLSRPYHLGPASVRRHNIPLCAVPCLQYRAAHVEETTKQCPYILRRNSSPNENGADVQNDADRPKELTNGQLTPASDTPKPTPEQSKTLNRLLLHAGAPSTATPDISHLNIPTAIDSEVTYAVTAEQLREYCTELMSIKKIQIQRYRTWKERRENKEKERKQRLLDVPTGGPGNKRVLKFQVQPEGKSVLNPKLPKNGKEWILNPHGKSYVCVLHEYMQHVLKKAPHYVYLELENASAPYGCTVNVDGVQYGLSQGSSKKLAKHDAAKKALEILIPQMRDFIKETEGPSALKMLPEDLSFFDEIPITDPRVTQLCVNVSEPTPYSILLTCIQRNFGLGENNIEFKMHSLGNQKHEVEMKVGKHTVKLPCRSKKDGKQIASQAILQAMHPHINTWGSMLRLYGNQSMQPLVEKKALEKGITVLQGKAAVNEPNYAILEKLKFEMDRLCKKKESFRPIGKFQVPTDVEMPSASSSNLKNVDI